MTTIVHAAGAPELLAAIPVLTGFTPRDSVVLLPFRRSRTAGALRFDLPDAADPTRPSPEEFASAAMRLVLRVAGADGLAVAVYADAEDAATGDARPASALVEALLRHGQAAGLHIIEALHVGAESWSDYRDREAPPHPLSDLPAPPLVPGFAGPAPDQFSGMELPRPGLFAAEYVGRALLALERVLGPAGPNRSAPTGAVRIDPRAHETALLLDDLPSFLDEVLDAPETASPFATAALVWVLNRPILRDVALVQWASSIDQGDRALAAQLDHSATGKEVPADVGGILIGLGPRPDPDRLGVALALLRRTIALAPRQARGGPLAAAAWLSWALGRSTHAARYLDQAQEADPDLSFARLLRTLVESGMLPDWAFGVAVP